MPDKPEILTNKTKARGTRYKVDGEYVDETTFKKAQERARKEAEAKAKAEAEAPANT